MCASSSACIERQCGNIPKSNLLFKKSAVGPGFESSLARFIFYFSKQKNSSGREFSDRTKCFYNSPDLRVRTVRFEHAHRSSTHPIILNFNVRIKRILIQSLLHRLVPWGSPHRAVLFAFPEIEAVLAKAFPSDATYTAGRCIALLWLLGIFFHFNQGTPLSLSSPVNTFQI